MAKKRRSAALATVGLLGLAMGYWGISRVVRYLRKIVEYDGLGGTTLAASGCNFT